MVVTNYWDKSQLVICFRLLIVISLIRVELILCLLCDI